MTTRTFRVLAAACAAGLFAGCVDRRFVVETNVPGAQINVDGKPIGPSPADGTYLYAGGYEFQAVAPGYEPLTKRVKFRKRWYDYPGLDFVAEVLVPVQIEDVRRVRLDLVPAPPVRTDELLQRADDLRAKGNTLPPQSVPDAEPGSSAGVPPGQGRVVPPSVPPPFPTSTETGVPAALPPTGPSAGAEPGMGYGTFNR